MTTDFKSRLRKLPYLLSAHVTLLPQEPGNHVERGAEATLAEDRGGSEQVGFATIIKCNCDGAGRELESLSHINSAHSGGPDCRHLAFKFRKKSYVPLIARR